MITQYEIDLPVDHRTQFTDREKQLLRPMAETLAMLDGNAFFKHGNVYECYLAEAWQLFRSNGGETGHAGGASWIREHLMRENDPTLASAWDQYQTAVRLVCA